MNNLRYLLALNRIQRVGPRTVACLLERWPQLSKPFELPYSDLVHQGLPEWLAQAISGFDLHLVQEDLNWANASTNNHLISIESPNYPSLLKEITDAPIVLYAQGDIATFNPPALAIVGSRNPSITGLENAKQFAKGVASQGITIVSGLALGVDAQAHIGCIEASGKTIAVLGTGIDCIYPRRHLKLAQQVRENGLLLSEFPLKSPPKAGHFPRRNRIISGLSLCTLVVEAAIKSGSLITARMAMEQNRDVLAIPGSIHNPLAQGCHYLLQQGAKLVTKVVDVLDEFELVNHQPTANKDIFSLASKNENLVQFIGFETTNIDQIVVRSGYSLERITSELAQLELEGAVVSVPGGYIRCNYER